MLSFAAQEPSAPMLRMLKRLLSSAIVASLVFSSTPDAALAVSPSTIESSAPRVDTTIVSFYAQAVSVPVGSVPDRRRTGYTARLWRMATDVLRGGRVHLFEFTDHSLPSTMGSILRFAIGAGFEYFRAQDAIAKDLASFIGVVDDKHKGVLEVAAGSGDASVQIHQELRRLGHEVPYLISDLYPDLSDFRRARESAPGLTFLEESVSALDIPTHLLGIRVLVASFHHFRPEPAKQILQSAYEAGYPIAIYERTERRPREVLLAGPLCILFMLIQLPQILRRFSWRGALWFVPAALAFAWDATVSNWRTYTFDELRAMVQGLDGYHWEMGTLETGTNSGKVHYLRGAA
jgi:hypothetical protein